MERLINFADRIRVCIELDYVHATDSRDVAYEKPIVVCRSCRMIQAGDAVFSEEEKALSHFNEHLLSFDVEWNVPQAVSNDRIETIRKRIKSHL